MSTFTPIDTITLTSSASSITISSLPQNYSDLVVQILFGVSTGADVSLRFNDDSNNSNYRTQRMFGFNGTSMQANFETALGGVTPRTPANQGTAIVTPYTVNIMNYSNTSTYKSTLGRYGYPLNVSEYDGGLWLSNSAITSLTLVALAGPTFSAGTIIKIYGVEAGTAKAQGGNFVTTDGTYWYHTYTSSGTFQPYAALNVDYLVVAGGGGGGGGVNVTNTRSGGGGGAGGVRCTVGATGGGGSVESALALTAQSYTVTVGAGGAAGANNSSGAGSAGSNSVFATITSIGGGAGGLSNSDTATTGGSGGGGGTANNGKAGTSGQGYAGGNAAASSNAGGGGGGAGAVGGLGGATTGVGGNGGNGITTSISGTSTTYGGGGGGAGGASGSGTAGSGGTGGGGAGGLHSSSGGAGLQAVAGTANRGGGGGGGSCDVYSGNPGAGGSGIVIVRYSV